MKSEHRNNRAAGRIRQIRPEDGILKVHYVFDGEGNYAENGDVVISIEDLRRAFRDLIAETKPRSDLANWGERADGQERYALTEIFSSRGKKSHLARHNLSVRSRFARLTFDLSA